jgi:hypothetical protein
MRASISSWVRTGVVLWLLALALPLLPGCSKEVKADFPRPPATAATTPRPSPDPPTEPAPEPAAPVPDATEAGQTSSSPSPPTAAVPRPRPKPRPEAPAEDAPPPEPPSTQLAHADESDPDPELARKLERASLLLGSVSSRSLSPELTEQLTAARAFVAQARQALADGDERRALILIDKGLILAQDVERLSRP